jgi:Leucine-rich repeat (LRR) protein
MKYNVVKFILVFCCWINSVSAQVDSLKTTVQSFKVYTWEMAQNASPDSIFAISFEKLKLDSIPHDLMKYTQLKELYFGKNKLTNLPSDFILLKKLEVLDLSRNDFFIYPLEICQLTELKRLIINKNDFEEIPDCIRYNVNLEFIDLWETPIMDFPDAFMEMNKLVKIDARGITHGHAFHQKWKERLPNVKLLLDPPCNCMN